LDAGFFVTEGEGSRDLRLLRETLPVLDGCGEVSYLGEVCFLEGGERLALALFGEIVS
jgi:hypothetical protein